MSAVAAQGAPRFVRRTRLSENEYHTNFRKIDCEIISRLTSAEAGRVTSQMCKVYLSLLNAPAGCWEREGVLRFSGAERVDGWQTAWKQLTSLLGVASATAHKALAWMHAEGIIGYFAGKNGVGIRVFLNRAAGSIGRRLPAGQKNLRLVGASNQRPRTSSAETPFKDSFADLEGLEIDLTPRAPETGAEATASAKTSPGPDPAVDPLPAHRADSAGRQTPSPPSLRLDDVVSRLLRELEPALQTAARLAAAREHERTREWLESRGLPKAARVAQREAFDLLRRHGLVVSGARARPAADVGRGGGESAPPGPLTPGEVRELAEACVAMLEVQGRAIDVTLADLSVEVGGPLTREDASKVRELAEALARGGGGE